MLGLRQPGIEYTELLVLGKEFPGKVAQNARDSLSQSERENYDHRKHKGGKLETGGRYDIEGFADIELDIAVGEIVDDRTENYEKRQMRIAPQVGKDPAHRALAAVSVFFIDLKFPIGHIFIAP